MPTDKVLSTDEKISSDSLSPAQSLENFDDEQNIPEWLTKVNGLNVDEGINHCGGLEEYLEVLTIYANSITTGADEIEEYFNAEDWKNYTTKVHALKSSSKVIGADELSERAKRLEDAGNSGYFEEIKQDTKPLLELYRSFAEKLKPLIQVEEDISDKPMIDESELTEAFEAMKDTAASFDYDSLMFIFQSLDEYKLPDDEAKRYKQIKEAASKLDWEKINTLLNEENANV